MQVHGDGEEPCPESGDGGRVQAQKMPPFCEVVETLRQGLVYCGWSGVCDPRCFPLSAIIARRVLGGERKLQVARLRSPGFLLRFVALMHCMRLSLRKGAHAALSSATWQEFRVGMTKGRAVTFVMGRQSGWKERNSRSLHYASLRSG